jgi:hypothetical protein
LVLATEYFVQESLGLRASDRNPVPHRKKNLESQNEPKSPNLTALDSTKDSKKISTEPKEPETTWWPSGGLDQRCGGLAAVAQLCEPPALLVRFKHCGLTELLFSSRHIGYRTAKIALPQSPSGG